MKTKIFLTLTALFLLFGASGQKAEIELTMTAIDNESYVALDSIKVMNLTQELDTLLVWPDTVLFGNVGVSEFENKKNLFRVFPNYPNPVAGETKISVYVPDKDNMILTITDVSGRLVIKSDRVLSKGLHTFRFQPAGAYLYFFTAQWRGNTQSIKILQLDTQYKGTCVFDYIGNKYSSSQQLKYADDIQTFKFNQGDELLLIGYSNDLQSGMLEKPNTNETCTFQFATNIPCPGTPTVNYEGQVYNAIQIFGQCWLKESLNVGTMINGTIEQLDNGTVEKYCYNDDLNNCSTYGGLYQWNEMMQYTTTQGTQGICPPGWHLPKVEEWNVLFGAVDSYYGIGDPEWYVPSTGFHGYDAATNLKTSIGWDLNGNGIDLFGFSGLPGGYHGSDGVFDGIGIAGNWWTSRESNNSQAWHLILGYDQFEIGLGDFINKTNSISVRCLRDE